MTTALLNNRYQILENLGRGGFGETFLAIDTHMPSARKCVIKQLKPLVQSPNIPQWLQERFQREAAVLEELGEKNPQIPRLYAYFSQDSDFYLVQEWIEGLTLTQQYQQQGNFSEEAVTNLLVNLLPVLEYIHHRRIIHRDLKPDNIILRASDGLPVLIDFGVIKEAMATVIHGESLSAYSVALGTPGYMASEQAAGRPVYSSDLYSLGLTCVFLLTGKTPQYLETDPQTGEILWRKAAPNLHSNLATVIDRAIRFHPRDRFSAASEMLAALETVPQEETQATLVVAPGNLSSRNSKKKANPRLVSVAEPPPPITPSGASEATRQVYLETSPEKSGWKWLSRVLIVSGVMFGGFILGFSAFISQNPQRSRPSPSPVFQSPEPETLPTPEESPENNTPRTFPTPRQREVTPPVQVSPTPEVTPTPTETPTPEGEVTPTPTEETPTPEGEVTPTPTETPTPTPSPETSATPTETLTPTPSPETSPTPTETLTPTPLPEVTPTPQPTPETPPPSTPEGQNS